MAMLPDEEKFREGKWFKCIVCFEAPCPESTLLPCFHMVCKTPSCNQTLKSNKTEDGSDKCPACEATFDPSQLKNIDKKIVELVKLLLVQKCCPEKNDCNAFCKTCQLRFCKDCLEIHDKIKPFKNEHMIGQRASKVYENFKSSVIRDIGKLKSTYKGLLDYESKLRGEVQKIRQKGIDIQEQMKDIGLTLAIQVSVQAEVETKIQKVNSYIHRLSTKKYYKRVYPFLAFLGDFLEADISSLKSLYSQNISEISHQLVTEMNKSLDIGLKKFPLPNSSKEETKVHLALATTSLPDQNRVKSEMNGKYSKTSQSEDKRLKERSPSSSSASSHNKSKVEHGINETPTFIATPTEIIFSRRKRRSIGSKSTMDQSDVNKKPKGGFPATVCHSKYFRKNSSTSTESTSSLKADNQFNGRVSRDKEEKAENWSLLEEKYYDYLDNWGYHLEKDRCHKSGEEGSCGICFGGGNIIMCDGKKCTKAFHLGLLSKNYKKDKQQCCHIPQIEAIPSGKWQCFFCLDLEKLKDESFLQEAEKIYFVPGNEGIYTNFQTFLIACKFINDLFKVKTSLIVRRRLATVSHENYMPVPLTLIKIRDLLMNLTAIYPHESRASYTSMAHFIRDCDIMMKQAKSVYERKLVLTRDSRYFDDFKKVYEITLSKYKETFPQHFM